MEGRRTRLTSRRSTPVRYTAAAKEDGIASDQVLAETDLGPEAQPELPYTVIAMTVVQGNMEGVEPTTIQCGTCPFGFVVDWEECHPIWPGPYDVWDPPGAWRLHQLSSWRWRGLKKISGRGE